VRTSGRSCVILSAARLRGASRLRTCLAVLTLSALAPGCGGAQPREAEEGATGAGERPRAEPSPFLRRTELLGRSSQGRPIRAVERGAPGAPRTVLVVGCIHGTECAGTAIARGLLAEARPRRSRLWVIPQLNPDGHALGTRLNGRGVDLNRNFPSQWRPIGRRWDPEYAGPRPLSELESRLAARLIERTRPDLSIWFHQPQGLVRAWGPSVGTAQRYARLAGVRFRALPWLSGTAPNWQNRHVRSGASFVVELPAGPLPNRSARRHADAVRRLAP